MHPLNVLTAALGLIYSASAISINAVNQIDSSYNMEVESPYHSIIPAHTIDEEIALTGQPDQTRQPLDASEYFEQSPDSSKKSITVVNNSNEIDLPTMIDPNPMLTAILSYDPAMYRVWPREPSVLDDENLMDKLRVKPLFLPLVYSLHASDISLYPRNKTNTAPILSTPRMDSLLCWLQREQEEIQREARLLQVLESSMVRYVQYGKEELPEADPLEFILKEEKPMYLEGAALSLMEQTIKRENNYPGVAYDHPWTRRGQFKLHFSETYLSSNWSKGGESNMAGLATIFLEANYTDLRSIQLDNSLEIKVGLNTVSTDSLRNLNVSSDQLRALSKLGIKMRNNWYYSLSSEFVTQLFNNYRKNTMNLLSSFMSPAKLFVSLGVDFKKSNNKKGYNLSVMLSPITYKANYLYDNVNLNPKSYGIDPGKHFGSEIGSKVSSNITWKFSERLNWKSKIYYFTDYTYVDTEWENTLDMSLNDFISTQLYLYAKMDDRLKRKPGESLIQLQQLLSFGMTYHF